MQIKKWSKEWTMFLGRYQPFHTGHEAIIRKVLDSGQPVLIVIRNTERDAKNPYTVWERVKQIRKVFPDYEHVRIMIAPNIMTVAHGRTPQWSVKEILPSKEALGVSASKIRSNGLIVWLTGNSHSGKTTLANIINKRLPHAVVIDGDEMRNSVSRDLGFSLEDRMEQNQRVARLAGILAGRGNTVIVSVIAPTEEIRCAAQAEAMYPIVWIYIKRALTWGPDRPYSPPLNPDLVIDTDVLTPEEGANSIVSFLTEIKGANND